KALKDFMLDDLGLGKLHPFKLRSAHKTFSMQTYANRLLWHYIGIIHRDAAACLSARLAGSSPVDREAVPLSEMERLVGEIPLSVPNAKPWIDMIWQLLLQDIPQPENHKVLRSLGGRPGRAGRATKTDFPALVKPRKRKKPFAGEGTYIRSAIKESLKKY